MSAADRGDALVLFGITGDLAAMCSIEPSRHGQRGPQAVLNTISLGRALLIA